MTSSFLIVPRSCLHFRLIITLPCGSPLVVHGPPWRVHDNECGLAQLVRWDANGPYRHVLFVRVSDGLLVGEWREAVPSTGSFPHFLEGWRRMLEHLKKAASKALARPGDFEVTDDDFVKKWPALYCFIAANVTEDGELRERCKVQVFSEGGQWKACLMDPGNEASLFITLNSPVKVWDALEKALAADHPDWRQWKKNRKRS